MPWVTTKPPQSFWLFPPSVLQLLFHFWNQEQIRNNIHTIILIKQSFLAFRVLKMLFITDKSFLISLNRNWHSVKAFIGHGNRRQVTSHWPLFEEHYSSYFKGKKWLWKTKKEARLIAPSTGNTDSWEWKVKLMILLCTNEISVIRSIIYR